MKRSRRQFFHLGAGALSAMPRIARAQAYPARPWRIRIEVLEIGGLGRI